MMPRLIALVAPLMILAASVCAAQAPYEPQPGQRGKDVVWIPSPEAMVEQMLDMARVSPADYVIDLGSGDGRNVIAAARRGARSLGVEYNPDLVELSRRNAAAAGVGDRATFVQGDMFAADISQASVLVLFLVPDNLIKLLPKFLALRPGTRIVSNTYEIGGGWDPDASETLPYCASWCGAHLYIVPARIAGTWQSQDGEFVLEQSFQYFGGTYRQDGIEVEIEGGRLAGNDLAFALNGVLYEGRLSGETMSGVASGRERRRWSARLASD